MALLGSAAIPIAAEVGLCSLVAKPANFDRQATAVSVATLTFNRPDRLNALSTPSMEGLLESLPRLARDAAVGVIVPAWWGRE